MAPNKFATKLNKNTNKITLVLVYAILEWILILLILLNSLFSYFINKFADYFGLKRPCLCCSRLDHLFQPKDSHFSYRSLVCEAHATEISQLGYCLTHRKLAESQAMCVDCSSSLPRNELFSGKLTFYPWMKQLGMTQDCRDGDKVIENGELSLKCSCCGGNLVKRLYFSNGNLIYGFWEDSDQTQKGNLGFEGEISDIVEKVDVFGGNRTGFASVHVEEVNEAEEKKEVEIGNSEQEAEGNKDLVFDSDFIEIVDDNVNGVDGLLEKEEEPLKEDDFNVLVDYRSRGQNVVVEVGKDRRCEAQQLQHLEFFIDRDDCHLIPIDLECKMQEKPVLNSHGKVEEEDFVLEFDMGVGKQYDLVVEEVGNLEEEEPLLSVYDIEEQPEAGERISRGHMDKDFAEEIKQVAIAQATEICVVDGNDKQESSRLAEQMNTHNQASEELLQMQTEDCEVNVSLGIPEQETNGDIQVEEVSHLHSCLQEEPSTSSSDYRAYCDHGFEQVEEFPTEFKTMTVEANELSNSSHLPVIFETNEIEDDAVPDTPTSVDSLHHINHKLLMLDRKESGTEESLDGSVLSDIEAGDGTLTMEKLKSALRAERKALNALYAELEEERNASAVAANQTMAMINRLQEEKAAMQMEALQYQRMMEEQSEYDQEALQLLNDLMVKREKEKEELEKEMQVFRKRLQDYEMKEKMMILKRRPDGSARSGTSSASCSNSEDGDGLSIDLNHERKEEDSFIHDNHEVSNQNTPADEVFYLEESLANFELERLSIIEQLKVLEEKLIMLSDEDEQHFEDIRPIEHFYAENGNGYHGDFNYSGEANGVVNGHYKETNGRHYKERPFVVAKAKRLLPLFDAIDVEADDGMLNGHRLSGDEQLNGHIKGVDSVGIKNMVHKCDSDDKKLAIEEEVDHVYERLQVLETDRDFLKHCISSLRKGDKGIELLQEILHHLHDLRCVERRVKA